MQVHRILSDPAFRAAAAATKPRAAADAVLDDATRINGTVAKVRAVLAKKGPASLIYLRRYADTLCSRSVPGSGALALDHAAFVKLASDGEWFLTPDETDALWTAAGGGSSGGGVVEAEALFRVVRGPLNPRRATAVHEAFRGLSGGTGEWNAAAPCLRRRPASSPHRLSRRVCRVCDA
jgi:hypothetical protein